MSDSILFSVAASPAEDEILRSILGSSGHYRVVTSLSRDDLSGTDVLKKISSDNFAKWLPTVDIERSLYNYMSSPVNDTGTLMRTVFRYQNLAMSCMLSDPPNLAAWFAHNTLWCDAVGHMAFLIQPDVPYIADLTLQVSIARNMGCTVIGVMPTDLRDHVRSDLLSLADVIVVGGNTNIIDALIGNLSEDESSGGK